MPLIHCTQKLLKELDVELVDPAGLKPPEGLGNWYANLLRIDRRKCLLFTNEKTLYSFLIPAVLKENLRNIGIEFTTHLLLNLRYEGFEAEVIDRVKRECDQIGFSRTASKSVLGSMNDLAYQYKVFIGTGGGIENIRLMELNHKINKTPMSAIAYRYPIEALKKELEGFF